MNHKQYMRLALLVLTLFIAVYTHVSNSSQSNQYQIVTTINDTTYTICTSNLSDMNCILLTMQFGLYINTAPKSDKSSVAITTTFKKHLHDIGVDPDSIITHIDTIYYKAPY